MDENEILKRLLSATKSVEVETILQEMLTQYGDRLNMVPIGNRENNRGIIEVNKDPGRGIVERITNGIDAMLELEFTKHCGIPICRSPREAACSWLNIPHRGLYELTPAQRREIAKTVIVSIDEGDDKYHRTVQVIDHGIGIPVENMPSSILSLGETNKLQKLYLAGAYGQGGSSTYQSCSYSVIACRLNTDDSSHQSTGYTIVFYQDLPAEQYKHGRYVYLTLDNRLLISNDDKLPKGTIVRHFGYDLTDYVGSLGPNSVYGLLQHALFDPIIPVFLEDNVHDYRRVIKGSRNALNGALDEDDERGPALSHNVPIFFLSFGDFGSIGIEYWVLETSEREKYPSRAYVDSKRPIILTINGQSHAELSSTLIRNLAELPFIVNRLIIHLDCNSLTPQAKRQLFISSREDVKRSDVYRKIEEELIKVLKSDDQLKILNEEAKNLTLKEKDEESEKQMRGEVAKILRFYGYISTEPIGGITGVESTDVRTPKVQRPHSHRITKVIDIHDPPTYLKILAEIPIEFYPEQRRYIRIETDAPSSYHNAEDVSKSKVNIILSGEALSMVGTTPLKAGRMRVVLDCLITSLKGMTGELCIELSRPGQPSLTAKVEYKVIDKPQAPPEDKKVSIPPMEWVPVDGQDDPTWSTLSWPDDINKVASSSALSSDKLIVYYSRIFPSYYNAFSQFERVNIDNAKSFENRYKIWLAVHSLLLEQDKRNTEDIELFEEKEIEERCRLATIASMFAAREIKSGIDTGQQSTE